MNRIWRRAAAGAVAVLCAAVVYIPHSSAAAVPAGAKQPFDDIGASYAREEIIDLYNRKIVTGTSGNSFSPQGTVTRAELITMLGRLLKLEPVGSTITPFKDVARNAWYYGWIQAAVQLELAGGTSAATFAPAQPVTRQEAAVWLARAFKQTGSTAGLQTAFRDSGAIAAWAGSAAAAVNRLGLMKGDDTGAFRPLSPITRQETAVLIYRVLQQQKWAAELEGQTDERIVMGWQYGQTAAEYQASVVQSNVNVLSPRWYFVGGNGTVSDSTAASMVTWAKNNGKRIWPLVGNRFDQAATHQLLSSPAARTSAVNQLGALVSKHGLDGLNLDFENVAAADKAALTAFVTQLAAKLHALGAVLSVDVSPDLGTDWTEAFDYAALGKQADYMVMMGYDEHYSGSMNPGSNASLPYVRQAVTGLLQAVPASKAILAMPLYTRDWTLKQGPVKPSSVELSLTAQNQLVSSYGLRPVWNSTLGQYVASYTRQSLKHTIWLEDGRSLTAKYNLAAEQKLAGIAYWHIGGESPDIWTSIRNAEKYAGYSF
ncbi:S-layer homology domain-containing protein [Paenibacillus sp. FSL R7-0273]|uniref:S-layer homology domain-containing protein n=1 Tax=Paenibacillus sp. FSL R7-0273 TaxID=1536772 RepID=UPI00063FBFCC|nr:S-layer homology domain-containing protein [Paenibacillus sp. FSL R7-0273]